MLDPAAVQAFVLVADLASFTRAAAALNSSQAAVSLKIRRLEEALGRRLLDRTPRLVRLSPDGANFLTAARELVAAQQKAIAAFTQEQRRITVSISHHIVGADLTTLLQHLHRSDPGLVVEVRIVTSAEAMAAIGDGSSDCAIVLNHDGKRRGGEVLFKEEFHWTAVPDFDYRPGAVLPLATQASPCNVRAMAVSALDRAGIRWSEVFVGGGAQTIGAAVRAGLAVAALARRVAPMGTVDVGKRLGLPPLPARDVVLISGAGSTAKRQAIKLLGGSFRALAGRSHGACCAHREAGIAFHE